MQKDLPQGEIHLAANYPLRLESAKGLCIACATGTIWITVSGEFGDIFLVAGQQHIMDSNRLALVEAIGRGSIRLRSAPVGSHERGDKMTDCGPRFSGLWRLIFGNGI